jgi:hypothetical protein
VRKILAVVKSSAAVPAAVGVGVTPAPLAGKMPALQKVLDIHARPQLFHIDDSPKSLIWRAFSPHAKGVNVFSVKGMGASQ